MIKNIRRLLSMLLALLLAVQSLPAVSRAAFDTNVADGDTLFLGENDVPRVLVSETAYDLADGVTEYVTYTNETNGLNQNIDYFCEIDLGRAEIIAGYPGMEKVLDGQGISWQMQGVSDQVNEAQRYFDRSETYKGYKIVAGLNGDFYNMATGEPEGALVINGAIYHQPSSYYFGITKAGRAVISDSKDLSDMQQAVGGRPLLVENGNVVVSPGGRNVTYTAIGIKADGNVVAMVCHGQSYPLSCGYTAYEVAQMLKARGCVTALLLDGSGSSTYVSRREGEDAVTLRNSPSDGMERMTTSSLMIVTDRKSDGVFDHAVVEPVNQVYTPGSTVKFTAAGVDAGGGAAQLPPDLSWGLADASLGSIDGKSGIFTSNGQCGAVTVQASSDGRVVGESTILIQEPDQLLFSAETVSVGFGSVSALGFQARYEGRTVHYKDGDFLWTVSNSDMGYFQGNLFHASDSASLTGSVTVVSSWTANVTASVALEVGKLPLVAMDFEGEHTILHGTTKDALGDIAGVFLDDGAYTTDSAIIAAEREGKDMLCVSYTDRNGNRQPQVGRASVGGIDDGYPVRADQKSVRIDYDFTENAQAIDGVCFGYAEDIELEGNPTSIGVWVFVPEGTPNLWLRLRYSAGGNSSQLDFTPQPSASVAVKDSGLAPYADGTWHYFEADISKLPKPVIIPAGMSLRVMVAPGINMGYTLADGSTIDKSECYGSLYFDNLTYIFGSNNEDTLSPVITEFTVNDQPLKDGMVLADSTLQLKAYAEDAVGTSGPARFNTGLDMSNLILYVDGCRLDAMPDSGEGSIRHDNVVLANGEHLIKVLAKDLAGNETVASYRVTVSASGNAEAPVTISAGTAVVGETITVDFTARNTEDIDEMKVSLAINKDYRNGFSLEAGPGYTVTQEAEYDPVRHTVSFAVRRSGNGGAKLASLRFQVSATAAQGTRFSCHVYQGQVTYTDRYQGNELGVFGSPVITAAVSAGYTVEAGTLVYGMPDQFFTISTAGGAPASGVKLYDASTQQEVGISDANGRVPFNADDQEPGLMTVYAKDADENVSFSYTAIVYAPKGNDDGTPTLILTNAASNASTGKNLSWLSNPLKAAAHAVVQVSETRDGVATGSITEGTCRLAGFATDRSAAYACGAVLTGLNEGKTYYYRVGDGQDGHWSDVRSFTVPYSGIDTDLLILGDLQEQDNSNVTGILESLDLSRFELAIQTGDLVDNGGNYGYWLGAYQDMQALDGVDRLNSLGNHEREGGFDVSGLLYHQEKSYYSVTYGNTYIATIGYCGSAADYREALDWLVADARRSDAPWKLLVTHQPPYYTNTAGGNDAVHVMFPAAAEEAGIDVVLSGHDHTYARTEPLRNGAVDRENGITYLICGSLGEKAYAATENPDFHFAKLSDDFNAVYLTLSASDSALTITAYDYANGKSEVLDTWTKAGDSGHTHSYVWDGAETVRCSCGYSRNAAAYTGYAEYTVGGKTGQVYLHLGVLQKGVFAVGSEVLHAGEDGLLHDSETVSTATCTKDGYLCCFCHDDNTIYQLSAMRYTGHHWDENHICTNRIFSLETGTYEVCGYHGRDISKLPVTLGYQYGFYTGEARRPAVSILDKLDDGTPYRLLCQSTYGDCVPYYSDNVQVGRATIRIEGYGNYYGEQTLHFDIVPNNVSKIEALSTTANSVTLSWDAAEGAQEYIVYENISGTWTRLGVVPETTYVAAGLSAGDHQFRIRPRATVNDEYFHSTKNSDILTVSIGGSGLQFSEGGNVVKTYGDAPFVNAASLDEQTDGFTYISSNPEVAAVDELSGQVTILTAGDTIITARRGETTGQYRLTVTPITVGLSWTGGETRMYDGHTSAVVAEATGVLGGDTVHVTVTGGNAKDAGTHIARAVSLDNRNYRLPQAAALEYVITPAPLQIVWSNTSLYYSGRERAPTAAPGEGLIAGDSVTFGIRGATEPGSYVVTAVSANSNYVVAEGQEAAFTISMPSVTVRGGDGDQLTCYLDGTTIRVCGTARDSILVNVIGTSATVSRDAPIGSITFAGVTYEIDASAVVEPTIDMIPGPTQAVVGDALDEAAKEAAEAAENGFSNLVAAAAPAADALAAEAASKDQTASMLRVSMYLEALSLDADSYTVDIKPLYTVHLIDSEGRETVTDEAVLPNSALSAPVRVTLRVPSSMTLDEHTYILHQQDAGTYAYLKPLFYHQEQNIVSFLTDRFSTFTVYSDPRSVSVTFAFDDGSTQTRTFGPSEVGAALPADTREDAVFQGWDIGGTTYQALEEALLETGGELQAQPVFRANGSDRPSGGGSSRPVEKPEPVNPFTDVAESDWFYDAVRYVHENGLFRGVTDTAFMPKGAMTRAMLVTVLYRTAGEPAQTQAAGFTDVAEDAWYADAVAWAVSNGIVEGYGNGRFRPDAPVTREQMAAILHRYRGAPETEGSLSAFSDAGDISAYAETAVRWAVEAGVMQGSGVKLLPKGNASRAEVAAMLMRMLQQPAEAST